MLTVSPNRLAEVEKRVKQLLDVSLCMCHESVHHMHVRRAAVVPCAVTVSVKVIGEPIVNIVWQTHLCHLRHDAVVTYAWCQTPYWGPIFEKSYDEFTIVKSS